MTVPSGPSGGPASDGEKVLQALGVAERPICVACLLLATGLPDVAVAEALEYIAREVEVSASQHRCHRCGKADFTYSLYRR
jgi:hypothetical protein